MVREVLGKHYIGMNKEFRFRGEEPGRLENFSDAVFALAITLLLISTSAPSNFDQIKKFVWELIPFCACMVLIVMIWHEHFVFLLSIWISQYQSRYLKYPFFDHRDVLRVSVEISLQASFAVSTWHCLQSGESSH